MDQTLFEHRAEWNDCFETLVSESTTNQDLVLPVAIHADAARVAKSFADVNHIVVKNPLAIAHDENIFQAVYTALLRLLVEDLPHIFLCHAKADGTSIAKNVRQYINEHTQLSCFFDMHDIPHGHGVKKSIEESIQNSAVLVIWTDKLLDSPWCQFEIIQARRLQRPMLVLDALKTKTPRLFPFLGNMPVVRWKRNPASVISEVLLELIRSYHLEAIFRSQTKDEKPVPTFGLHQPDLLDHSLPSINTDHSNLVPRSTQRSKELFIYPDPPLKQVELDVLCQVFPKKWFLSLAEWQALRAANALLAEWNETTDQRPNPLKGICVGISVSSSDNWAEMGLIAKHQDDFSLELALQLILLGAKVVWGGDLRPEGFGTQLKWIVQTYQHPSHPPQDHVAMFSPYTLELGRQLSAEEITARRQFADVRLMDCPILSDSIQLQDISANSPEGKAITALALSAMRAELAVECDIRIVLGGGLLSFQGLYPGIAEEAYETIKKGKPLYIIGGYGGASKAIYDTIASDQAANRKNLIDVSYTNGAAAIEEVRISHGLNVKQANKPDWEFNPEEMVKSFSKLGLEGLSQANGLSKIENERLSRSQDIHEILDLIVRGFFFVKNRSETTK
nr:TIR domain-containing protein [Granulosicoccus sp.]